MAASERAVDDAAPRVEPFTEQEPFLYDAHRYYGFLSGVGAGKTAVGVMRAALNVELWNPGYMGAIVAPTTQMVKNAIIPVMREFGLMDRWEYQGPQAEAPGIHTPNGSRIVVLSADNDKTIERLAALNLAWWWLDEARRTPERARQILIQRLRRGDYTNGFITTTPEGYDHNYDFFIGDHDPDVYAHGQATVHETGDRLAISGVPTDANPHIAEADKAAIREAHPPGIREQEVGGQFVEFGGGLLSRDSLTFVDKADLPGDREFRWVVTADLALESDPGRARERDTDYWAAAILAVDQHSSQAYLVDVTRTRGMTKDQGVGWLRGIMDGVPTNQVGIEANQAQRWFVQDAQQAGLAAYPIENRRKKEERLTYLSVPFANGSVKLVNHDGREPYDERWEAFVQEWTAFPKGAHDDLLDATEMAVRQVSLGAGIGAVEAGDAYGRGEA